MTGERRGPASAGPRRVLAFVPRLSDPGSRRTVAGRRVVAGRTRSPATGNVAPHLTDQSVRVPTLDIWGERDPYLLASNLDGLERFVPDLTVRRIPDAEHWVVHERPDLDTRSIREFIAAG